MRHCGFFRKALTRRADDVAAQDAWKNEFPVAWSRLIGQLAGYGERGAARIGSPFIG
jgi:hypothetical protein